MLPAGLESWRTGWGTLGWRKVQRQSLQEAEADFFWLQSPQNGTIARGKAEES